MVDKETVRRGYDELADAYAEQREPVGDGIDALERLLDDLAADGRVLDAGCGQGQPVLQRICDRATGVGADLSAAQLRLATENVPAAGLAQADMTRLPFASDTFDAVTAYYSLIHVPADEHQRVLEEFARVLVPGGRLLLVEGTNEWAGTNPDWLEAGAEMQWHIAGPEATRRHVRTAGFEVTGERVIGSSLNEASEWHLFEAERHRE